LRNLFGGADKELHPNEQPLRSLRAKERGILGKEGGLLLRRNSARVTSDARWLELTGKRRRREKKQRRRRKEI